MAKLFAIMGVLVFTTAALVTLFMSCQWLGHAGPEWMLKPSTQDPSQMVLGDGVTCSVVVISIAILGAMSVLLSAICEEPAEKRKYERVL